MGGLLVEAACDKSVLMEAGGGLDIAINWMTNFVINNVRIINFHYIFNILLIIIETNILL